MAVADELIALLGFELTGEANARRYESTMARLEKRVVAFGAAAARWAGIAAGAGVAAFGLLGRSVVGTSSQFEIFQATLETIEGSAEKARQSLDWIAEFGRTTPYDVAQVTEAFVRLKAYGIDPVANDALRTLGDTAAAMGKPLMAAVEMFADASTMEFERLKEFGIKAKQEGDNVTFAWTKNGQELTKTVKKSATEVRAFLLETLGDRFAGAMDRQSRTWTGMMSNLGDSWADFQRRIGEAGFFDSVKDKLSSLLDTIARLDADGRLDAWATSLSNALTATVDVLWAMGQRVVSITGFLIDNFDRLRGPLIAVGIAFGALLAWAFPVLSTFVAIGLAVDDFISYLQGGESYIGDFIEWVKRLPEALGEAASAFTSWLGSVDWGALGAQAGTMLVDALVTAITSYASAYASISQFVVDALLNVDWAQVGAVWMSAMQAQLELLLGIIRGIAGRVIELVEDWFDVDLTGIGARLANQLWEGMRSVGAAIRDWFMGLFQLPDWVRNLLGDGGAVVQPSTSAIQSGGAVAPAAPQVQSLGKTDEAWDLAMELQRQEWERMLSNAGENMKRLAPDTAVDATITDARQDNRQFPFNTDITINQQITQPVDAPRRAAEATAGAVSGAVTPARAQIETEPAF